MLCSNLLLNTASHLTLVDGSVSGCSVTNTDHSRVYEFVDTVVLCHEGAVCESSILPNKLACFESVIFGISTYAVSIPSVVEAYRTTNPRSAKHAEYESALGWRLKPLTAAVSPRRLKSICMFGGVEGTKLGERAQM